MESQPFNQCVQRMAGMASLDFSPLPIIELLAPIVVQCLGLTDGQQLNDVAQSHIDESGNVEPGTIRSMRPRTRLAAIRAKRQGKIDSIPKGPELDEISRALILGATNEDVKTLGACASAAIEFVVVE